MPAPISILILAALPAELAALRPRLDAHPSTGRNQGPSPARPDLRWATTGMGLAAAEAATRRELSAAPAGLVISTGCCGGLRQGGEPGLLVVPRRLLVEEGPSALPVPDPDPCWIDAALRAASRLGLPVDEGPLLSVRAPLLDPAAKRARGRSTGASAVDMESAAVARVAAALGVPHLCLRVLLDRLEDNLPGATTGSPLSWATLMSRLQQISGGLARCLAALLDTD